MAKNAHKDRALVALRKRIALFYAALKRGEFARCHEMIDPRVRAKPSSVTLLQYENSLREFLAAVGEVSVSKTVLELHLGEPNKSYEDRDFAVGQTTWTDGKDDAHVFLERWVREGRTWYTRSTGLLAPVPAPRSMAGVEHAGSERRQNELGFSPRH